MRRVANCMHERECSLWGTLLTTMSLTTERKKKDSERKKEKDRKLKQREV